MSAIGVSNEARRAEVEKVYHGVVLGGIRLRDLVHSIIRIAQIARVMAKQYRDAVGPWVEYHPVLTRR